MADYPPAGTQALYMGHVTLYLYEESGKYVEKGAAGVAVMGTPGNAPQFRLGCYVGEEYVCTANITNNNDVGIQLALQNNSYACFRDDQNRVWSMLFPSDAECHNFAATVTVAMYGASLQPEGRIVCCDATLGKKEKPIFCNDKVKIRYQSWVMSRPSSIMEDVPKLGSRLEGNEHEDKAYICNVPANHNSTPDMMIGFEGMIVGMCEEGRRFVVVPAGAKRGRGPNIHTVYMVYVVKKKDGFDEEKTSLSQHVSTNISQPDNMIHAPSSMGHVPAVPVIQHRAIADTVVYQDPQPVVVAHPVMQAQPAPQPTPQPPTLLPTSPPGFNLQQLETVDRMREQVGNLLVAIKEITGKVDIFAHDFRLNDQKRRPQTLAAAQMEYSIKKLIRDTEEYREKLEKKDELLKQLEEKHRDLTAKIEKFSRTAQQLSEDKKAVIHKSSEDKIALDQEVLNLQTRLTRVMSEREDTSRHLSTVKRLLEISDQDGKKEKNRLQVNQVSLQTTETKLAASDEFYQEERARRQLLEGKIAAAGDELRHVMEEFRIKDGQIEERRRKMDADRLHYTQLMEDERVAAADELRELRQELVEELAVRDRRYQEERTRVAREAFERGRLQGIQDGEAETLLEADEKMQTLNLEVQRHKTELETIKIRCRQTKENAEVDRRRLEAQIQGLSRVVDDLNGANHTAETELHALQAAKEALDDQIFDSVREALLRLSRPIGKRDLLGIVHQLRMKDPVSYEFESLRAEEEAERIEVERKEVFEWVHRRMVGAPNVVNQFELPPPLRPKNPPERLLPTAVQSEDVRVAAEVAGFSPEAQLESSPLRGDVSAVALGASASPEIAADVERRQREILEALHLNDPTLDLAPTPKEPTPVPTPEPEVQPNPTPPPEDPSTHRSEETMMKDKKDHSSTEQSVPLDETDTDLATRQAIPTADEVQVAKKEEETKKAEELPRANALAPIRDRLIRFYKKHNPEKLDVIDETLEKFGGNEDKLFKMLVEKYGAEPTDVPDEDLDEASPVPTVPAPAKVDIRGPSKSQELSSISRPIAPSRHATFFNDDDDEEEDDEKVGQAKPQKIPVPAGGPSKPAPTRNLFGDDDSDEDTDYSSSNFGFAKPTGKKTAPPAPKPASKIPAQKGLFADSDEDHSTDDGGVLRRPAPKLVAKKVPAKLGKATAQGLFESDSD